MGLSLGVGEWAPNLQQAFDVAIVAAGKKTYYPSGQESSQVQDNLRNDAEFPMIARKIGIVPGIIAGGGGQEQGAGRVTIKSFLINARGRVAITSNSIYNYYGTNGLGEAESPTWRLAAPFLVGEGESIYVELGGWSDGKFNLADNASAPYYVINAVGTRTGRPVAWAHSGTVARGRLVKSFRNVYGEPLRIVSVDTSPAGTSGTALKVECSSGINWGRAERNITPLGTGWNWDNATMQVLDFSAMPGGGQVLLPGEGFSFEVGNDTFGHRYRYFMEAYVKRSI